MASTISDDLRASALVYHRTPKPGKLEIQPTKPLGNQRDLALAYSPGVAAACEAIVADPAQAAELTARHEVLKRQSATLNQEVQRLETSLGQRRSDRERLESERESARTSQDVAAARLNDALAGLGSRGERLRVVDPGVVPERPSSPSIALNVAGALLIALVAALAYVSFVFARRMQTEPGSLSSAASYSVR